VAASRGRTPIVVDVPGDLRKLVTLYLETRGADLARLDQAIAASNLEEVRAIAHKIRGSSASLGFPEAGEIGIDMERAAIARDLRAAEGQVARLRDYFTRVRIRDV